MTEPDPAWPTTADTTHILRFLHRFADLMSNGSNAENLLGAARMLETQIDLLKQTDDLLRIERARVDASTEVSRRLEERIGVLNREILGLKSALAEQRARSEITVAELERRQSEFMQRAEEAESRLAALQAIPPAIPFGSIAVPLSTLRVARTQFESLARAFEKSGNIVSQVMCEASASSLGRAIREGGGSDDDEGRSQHAA